MNMGRRPLLALTALALGGSAAADGSGGTVESPWVGFSLVFGNDSKGPSEAGVLDARTGRVLWRESFPDYVWVRAWRNLLLVTAAKGERLYACVAYDILKGTPRFRANGRLWEPLFPHGRPLLVFEADDDLVAIDPATGLEAWTIRLRKDATARLTPQGDRIVARSGGTYTAYAPDDGRTLWESTGFPSDWFSLSGGRLWIFQNGCRRPMQLGMSDGRLRETPELPADIVGFIEQRDSVDFLLERSLVRLRASDLARVWDLDLPEAASAGWGDARTVVLDSRSSSRLLLVDAAAGRLLSMLDVERLNAGSSSSNLNHPRYYLKSIRPQGQATTLRILKRSDGRVVWQGKVDDYENGWKADSLLVRNEDRLRCLELPSGGERWWAPIQGKWTETERRGGHILIATDRGISALDVAIGRVAWRMDFGREAKDVTLSTLPGS